MSNERVQKIEALLQDAFNPTYLLVKDQSHLHAGHAGARDGRGHFDVRIEAEAFRDKRPLACHRLVYDVMGSLMETDIHALSIQARAPAD